MRSVVSLVETRPETVVADYRRAMDLAGMNSTAQESPPILLARAGESGFQPGFSSPPWQFDGVLEYFGGEEKTSSGPMVFPVRSQGADHSAAGQDDWGWAATMAKNNSALVPVPKRELRPVRPANPLPALGAVLPNGFGMPPALAGSPVTLLPTPVLNRDWQLSGCVSLLSSLLAGRTRKNKMIPRSEIIAETLGLALEVMGPMTAVMDATIWGVYREDGKAHPLIRNVILAGKDPVAVDAVAARLGGLDPSKIPWLKLCAIRGLGSIEADKIVIKGRSDLLGLDFQFPKGTFSSGPNLGSVFSWPGRVAGSLGRKNLAKGFGKSAWGHLMAEYLSGAVE